jgi:hypothetical protein
VAHWIGLVNGFSNPVSKINKVEIYIPNGSVKGKIYPWSYIYDQGSKGVKSRISGTGEVPGPRLVRAHLILVPCHSVCCRVGVEYEYSMSTIGVRAVRVVVEYEYSV